MNKKIEMMTFFAMYEMVVKFFFEPMYLHMYMSVLKQTWLVNLKKIYSGAENFESQSIEHFTNPI
jgi:hypothetical protein